MKAYQIKITLEDSNPVIWRRIIVPEEITFKKLHDIIQISMGWKDQHMYDFELKEEKLRITCDDEAIAEYEIYSRRKLTEKNDPHGFIANMLKIEPKFSHKVKIDKYFTRERNIRYIYDFGDYWKHNILVEEILENYENIHPLCVEGEGACPPEDVGGIVGYIEFQEILKNKNHPEYSDIKEWVDNQGYNNTFNIDTTNKLLTKIISLKKIIE